VKYYNLARIIQGALNLNGSPFGGASNKQQMYGKFDGISPKSGTLFGMAIYVYIYI